MAQKAKRGWFAAARSVWVLSPLVAALLLVGAAHQTRHLHRRGHNLLLFLGACGGAAALGTLVLRRMNQGDTANLQTLKLRNELLAHLDALQRADARSRCTEADVAGTAAPAEYA